MCNRRELYLHIEPSDTAEALLYKHRDMFGEMCIGKGSHLGFKEYFLLVEVI